MSEKMVIDSHVGPYEVHFTTDGLARLRDEAANDVERHFIIDARVAELYKDAIAPVLERDSVLLIDATETAKSLERMPEYVEHLVGHGLRRDHVLCAVGGGIVQDITSLLATILLRGVDWCFYPTTLLAQTDSCIGSKSSINCGSVKNIVGTFNPPNYIQVDPVFLESLDPADVRSGVGEMLKVHAIAGPEAFDRIAADYPNLFSDPRIMLAYIHDALGIKKVYIEEDEFDRGRRRVFNYGHTFGHAIEAATNFAIPHGVAVTMGMDMANYVAWRKGKTIEANYRRMKPTLTRNYAGWEGLDIPWTPFHRAISRDKKNVGDKIVAILLDETGNPVPTPVENDATFQDVCLAFVANERHS